MKRFSFFIFIISLILIHQIPKQIVKANEADTCINLIFDKTSYAKTEEVNLTINLDKFAQLGEVKLQIKVDNTYLVPVLNNDTYFQLTNSSIFSKAILNDFVDQSILRFHLIKDQNIKDGYYSGLKNNIAKISFIAQTSIEQISDYLQEDNISIYLFDTVDNIIPYTIKYSEKLTYKWLDEQTEYDVFAKLPNFFSLVEIINRTEDEYQIYYEQNINENIIGTQVLLLGIYDITNADYIIIAKAINIVDKIKPIINAPNEIIINDFDLESKDLLLNVICTDNYDQTVNLQTTYYTSDNQVLLNYNDLIVYLNHHVEAYLTFNATDVSNNKAVPKTMKVIVQDTTPPIINELTKVDIIDNKKDEFVITSLFNYSDAYDEEPILDIKYYCQKEVTEIEFYNQIFQGYEGYITYQVVDNCGNKTDLFQTVFEVIDTTPPVIYGINDLTIIDQDVYKLNLTSNLQLIDNFYQTPSFEIKYYDDNNKNILIDAFLKRLSQGLVSYVTYQAIDNSGNLSELVKQQITVTDTIKPTIKVLNIKEDGKYTSLEQLKYEITDNFINELITEITLNDIPYNNESINKVGEYTLVINVTDQALNKQTITMNFAIIEDNVIGCGIDIECYLNNYIEVVIIVSGLLTMVIAILIGKLIMKKRGKGSKSSI